MAPKMADRTHPAQITVHRMYEPSPNICKPVTNNHGTDDSSVDLWKIPTMEVQEAISQVESKLYLNNTVHEYSSAIIDHSSPGLHWQQGS